MKKLSLLFVIFIGCMFIPLYLHIEPERKSIYSVYIIWDGQIIENFTTEVVDSSLFVLDSKSQTHLLINKIQ